MATPTVQTPPPPSGPPGTYPSGTIISLDATKVRSIAFSRRVWPTIEYTSILTDPTGGFAHVYIVRNNLNGEKAVLKRTACPDENSLAVLMKEINVMYVNRNRNLYRGIKNIVDFYDSSVSKSRHGGFEVNILMEYCSGGQLVDYMNTKLQERLKEHEVLAIFFNVCEAVAHMHYMPDPILHRDIKVENVLLAKDGTFKLCDFGSASHRKIEPNTSLSAAEIRAIEEELPEICDLYQKKGITEKIDIWALGVFLYKLCFFVRPFDGLYLITPIGNTL
ncbi:kinase-like domain-containing protein [Chytridium lagenaria]|nr:kinase-like domain-containing protein [Chytridium lagenaria]